jgi:hypothetical protein
MIVILKAGIYELCYCVGNRWHDIHTYISTYILLRVSPQ